MKLAFVTTHRPLDATQWSGLGLYLPRALAQAGLHLEYIGGLEPAPLDRLIGKLKGAFYRLGGRRYLSRRTWRVAQHYRRKIMAALPANGVDVVFSPGTLPVGLLDAPLPIAFWTDATFAGMTGYYPGFANLCDESLREGNALEQAALERCRYAIYSSKWAAASALENYRVDPQKIKVVPFGANVESPPSRAEIEQAVAERNRERCRLIFISAAWGRKRGDIVVQIARDLNARGVDVELAIFGKMPALSLPPYIHSYGFVSKETPEGRRQLEDVLRSSHFLLLPSRAEAFGLAAAEANAFAVPALASNTGGLAEVVLDGVNGRTFRVEAHPSDYADCIAALWNDWPAYTALARSSRLEYERRLNWGVAGAQVRALLETQA